MNLSFNIYSVFMSFLLLIPAASLSDQLLFAHSMSTGGRGGAGGGGRGRISSALRSAMARHDPISLIDKSTTLNSIKQIHGQLLVNGHLQSKPTSTFTFNSLIRAYSKSLTPTYSFSLYSQILQSDNYTFTFLVRASVQIPSFPIGSAVHAAAVRRGFHSDAHVQSGLVHLYAEFGFLSCVKRIYSEMTSPDLVSQTAVLGAFAECGEIEIAEELFDEMLERDTVAWNTMIAGYGHVGRFKEALELFRRMQREDVKVDEATMVSVLSAIAHLGASDSGRWAHVFISRNRLKMTVNLGTALVDMYSKCGDLKRAMDVFWKMKEKNIYIWTAVMNGLAMNGAGEKCLEIFEQMRTIPSPPAPNPVTFVSILRGCSVAGLVDKGIKYFDMMKTTYKLEPQAEHYGLMVDIYGRAGRLEDAVAFLNSMPVRPHVGAWGALLHSCRLHGNKHLAELAATKMTELDSKHDGAHILLSNMYAESKDWDEVNRIRDVMRSRGVRKLQPGCSVIEINGETHEFFVSTTRTHRRYAEIEAMAVEMTKRIRSAGYKARTDRILFDIEDEEKEDALNWHSEKLAIAFGLVCLGEGEIIRIVNNLRICLDCHQAAKFISNIFHREIVIRDRNRFHHFKNGFCSCKDYW